MTPEPLRLPFRLLAFDPSLGLLLLRLFIPTIEWDALDEEERQEDGDAGAGRHEVKARGDALG